MSALDTMTPEEASYLFDHQAAFSRWFEQQDGTFSLQDACSRVFELMLLAKPPPEISNPHRKDAAELREFVKDVRGLPYQQRMVAKLCLVDGATIDQCAAAMGIGRESVRTYLRRIRQSYRYAQANARRGPWF
jgi:DNA-directed RNA polymerase specialized sigma24 family protein